MGEGQGRRGAGALGGECGSDHSAAETGPPCSGVCPFVSIVMGSSWGVWLLGRWRLAAEMPKAGPWGQAEVLPAPLAEAPDKDLRRPSHRAANSCR